MVSYVVCYARVNNNSVVTVTETRYWRHVKSSVTSPSLRQQCVRMSRSFFWYLNRERLVRSMAGCTKLADLMTTMLNSI